ncbi:MAG: hypothetical protein AB7N80_10190 [Bdellovibrionales bacterium]
MKYVFGFLMMFSGAAAWSEELPVKDTIINVQDVFVPGGFSQDSDAYVVVNGTFPNSCYRWNRANVTDKGNNMHEIVSVAKVTQGMCLMVLVPFSKDVRLGKLSRGEHTLRFINGDGTYFERTLEVE